MVDGHCSSTGINSGVPQAVLLSKFQRPPDYRKNGIHFGSLASLGLRPIILVTALSADKRKSNVRGMMAGASTAGFLGGFLYNTQGGSIAFLEVGVFDLIYVLVFVLLHFLINKYCTLGKFCFWHHSLGRHYVIDNSYWILFLPTTLPNIDQ